MTATTSMLPSLRIAGGRGSSRAVAFRSAVGAVVASVSPPEPAGRRRSAERRLIPDPRAPHFGLDRQPARAIRDRRGQRWPVPRSDRRRPGQCAALLRRLSPEPLLARVTGAQTGRLLPEPQLPPDLRAVCPSMTKRDRSGAPIAKPGFGGVDRPSARSRAARCHLPTGASSHLGALVTERRAVPRLNSPLASKVAPAADWPAPTGGAPAAMSSTRPSAAATQTLV